ncbi:MAG: TetR/AcrR family transcriptional regulator [Nitrospira sp.]|nr:TetR/AcrR family transcriptional regulator [Nitrospira sp.]
MALKKEKTETRKEQIIKATLDIIGEEGVQGLTTSGIARNVGISEANLYRHFENKDAILMAVIDHIDHTLSNNLSAVNTEAITPLEKLERIFKLHISMIQDNRGVPRIVFSSETTLKEDLREKMYSLINRYQKLLTGILKNGIRDKSIQPDVNSVAMAAMFIGMIQFCAMRWTFSNFRISLSEEGKKLWQTYRKIIAISSKQ